MSHVRELSDVKNNEPTVLAIGSFDGVHLGHQALVSDMVESSRRNNLQSVVLTFYPNPAVVLGRYSSSSYIHRPEEKASFLMDMGIDWVVTMKFDRDLAKISATDFIVQLRKTLDFKQLWCGENFAFGYDREGDIEWLTQNSDVLGFELNVANSVEEDGFAVSSSRVRNHISVGEVSAAALCLGRPLRVPGVVIQGAGRGESIGFPTANLSIWRYRTCPSQGVYLAYAFVDNDKYPAVVNIGKRPTFDDEDDCIIVEAHLLNYQGNLYGQRISLDFVDRLRDERKFTSVEHLVSQIHQDVSVASLRLV
ncbi:MAG: bifunctional riboflavin kinase/FAD synthetase [Anaerolineales bacterium]|nr:bifunctional riboflavin kinase/FAD synthetase [Anaerolineales bacterium]